MKLNSPATYGGYMVKLRNQRRSKGLTQAELAKQVGVTTNYISLIEKGKKVPAVKTINKIALALGIPASSLLENDLRKELSALAAQYDVKEMLNALEWLGNHLKSDLRDNSQ
jgi:transcriptional regulator with XRE-family HTH domain